MEAVLYVCIMNVSTLKVKSALNCLIIGVDIGKAGRIIAVSAVFAKQLNTRYSNCQEYSWEGIK